MAPTRVVLAVPSQVQRAGEAKAGGEEDVRWASSLVSKYGSRLVLHRVERDYGPAAKLLGCLEAIPQQEDDCLLVTDGDMVRPSRWARLLLHKHTCAHGSSRVSGGVADGPPGDGLF